MPRATNLLFMKLRRRAEASDPSTLVQTFVDAGPLFTRLSSPDHEILLGRRGTGKTHALHYLEAQVRQRGDIAIFVDFRKMGSTGGLYADHQIPIAERGTRLLIDTINFIHEELVDYALDEGERVDLTAALALLDRLAEDVSDVVVHGEHVDETREVAERQVAADGRASLVIGPNPQVTVAAGSRDSDTHSLERTIRRTGVEQHRVHFGAVTQTFSKLVDAFPAERIWILIDEWSDVPMDLQPLLADLLRRALFPVTGVTVKIAAIDQRSNFRVEASQGGHLGIELGADAAADIDLDDFMVFGNDATKAKDFFRELLFRHVRSIADEANGSTAPPNSANELIRTAFTQEPAFADFVRAAEGVPRDAINILMLAAHRADDAAIGVDHIRAAARDWYSRDKEKAVQASPQALSLLHWIIDTVIGERRARAFLLEQGERATHPLIGALYDARVLHVIKRGVATHDRPGVRYDVFALDYGCYVELMTTAKAPIGLFEIDDDAGGAEFVEVPADDYRSIRRAILDLNTFERGLEAHTST